MVEREEHGAGPDRERLLQLRFAAQPGELKHVRREVRRVVAGTGCCGEGTEEVVLAVDEACQNIIRHAYAGDPNGEIVLEIERRGGELVLSLLDFGPEIEAGVIRPRPRETLRPGGLGTHLIHEVMDAVELLRPESCRGNLLRMVKRIR